MHRLFVCIAGVADQLQTNFASDLRQILRSVFLMNMSPAVPDSIEAPPTAVRPKDADGPATVDLFEFRASEQDVVIQRDEREGSNQSIYSAAEEANAEDSGSGNDSVFCGNGNTCNDGTMAGGAADVAPALPQRNRQERSASFEVVTTAAHRHHLNRCRQSAGNCVGGSDTGAATTVNTLNCAGNSAIRTRSLGEEDSTTDSDGSSAGGDGRHLRCNRSVYTPENGLQQRSANGTTTRSGNVPIMASASARGSASSSLAGSHGSTGAGSPPHSHISSSGSGNGTMMSTAATAATPSAQPPRWVPDVEAPRCMACAQSFTTFRRRHHCRNCGGVFCGVCSAASAPLPKFGLIKAVRVCRDCFVLEVGA